MNWLHATVGDACLPTSQTDPIRSGAATFRYVDIAGVDRDIKAISRAEVVACAEAPSRARKLIRSSDVLVSTVRPNLNAVAFVPPELDGEIASTGFAVLRANPELLNSKFLFYWVQHREFIDFLVANATGASYPAVTDGVVKRARLPLATPKEQSRIVELLEEADRLRRLRRDADAKAARILPQIFDQMFGKPFEDQRWSRCSLGDVISHIRNGTTAEQNTLGRGLPVTRIETISAGIINLNRVRFVEIPGEDVDKWRLLPGDILFSHINSESHIAKTAIYAGEPKVLLHGMNLLLLRPDIKVIQPDYLFALLNTPDVRSAYRSRCKRAVNQASLNQKDISSLEIPNPPLDLQRKFSSKAVAVRELLSGQIAGSEKLEQLFDLLLHQAFSSQLTAKWREGHMKELLAEMEQQARMLNLPVRLETTS